MADVQHAQLQWDEQGQPLSCVFGDVYFSRANGLAETHHVFLANNQLPERFAALQPGASFVIGETGFGTGLNFLCARQLFNQTAPAGATLHFLSVERYPLSSSDLSRALALWPELKPLADELIKNYQAIHPGFQRVVLAKGRVVLTLMIGDVLEMLPQLNARIDAWFLDGFAPAKNPEMWNEALFKELARLSYPNTTLATFTSAGFVRRGLSDQGFSLCKVKGFAHKREMLAGVYTKTFLQTSPAWFKRQPSNPTRRAVVLGTGLAGASAAYSLAIRGWHVTVIDRQPSIAAETSGNAQGVLYLKLSSFFTPLTQFVLSGFGYTRRLLEHLDKNAWQNCGVLQIPANENDKVRHKQLTESFDSSLLTLIDADEATRVSGVTLTKGGLYFPEAGWVNPPALCQWLLEHPNIKCLMSTEITALKKDGDIWQLFAGNSLVEQTEQLVLANAQSVNELLPLKLAVKPIRGQITELAATQQSLSLQTVLCEQGYVAPAFEGEHTLGATFRFKTADLSVNEIEHQENLTLLRDISEDLYHRLNADQAPIKGRAGFRCTSPDYLPVVGPVSDYDTFRDLYNVLGKDSRQRPDLPCPWLKGLFVSVAHGSRGLISAPLCGEILAAWMNDEPLPVADELAQACHPNRFALKDTIRRKP